MPYRVIGRKYKGYVVGTDYNGTFFVDLELMGFEIRNGVQALSFLTWRRIRWQGLSSPAPRPPHPG